MKKNKAIVFDRDGTINFRIVGDYVKKVEEFRFLPDFLEFFDFVKDKDYVLLVATNQQGIGKKLMTPNMLAKVHQHMQHELMRKFKRNFDDIFHCPRLASENPSCRKPNPGMLEQAVNFFSLRPAESWMIGDGPADVLSGQAAGFKTALLVPDFEKIKVNPDLRVKNFRELKEKVSF